MAKIKLGLKALAQVPVAAAGTPVPLSATSLEVTQAVIQWDPNNTGDVYIGESDVTATKCLVLNAGTPAIQLDAEDTMADEDKIVFDLADVYVDAANSGDKVNIAYTKQIDKKYNS